jgi:hypothetical protein
MGERTVNWLIYTCLLGLIPVIARLVVWLISTKGVDPIAISDLVAFGLVLHSANINEVNRIKDADSQWKTVHNGFSIVFIMVYALLLFGTIASSDNLNQSSILFTTLLLGLASLAISFSILKRAQLYESKAS